MAANELILSKNRARTNKIIRETLGYVIKIAIGLLFMIPIFVMMSWSLRPDAELVKYGASLLPHKWTFEYYAWCFQNLNLFRYIINSFIQYAFVFAGHVVFSIMAAYAFVFCDFKGKGLVFGMILAAQAIPGEVTIIANYMTVQRLKWIDTWFGLCLPSVVSGMSIFMMRQHFLTIPKEMKEASEIDGCGDIRFMIRILAPLSVPSLASLAIYDFIHVYNSWLWPLLVTNKDRMRTVQVGLAMAMTGEVYDEYGRVLAASTVVIIPTLLIFIVGQEYLIRGLVSGSVKG